ncbi:integrase [Polaromonas sp. UC242_47]|uniref:integrase n=1 Tax=Polaromonas sp. UC242_47 TaxID=3374626 RepID=UPI0037985B6D
MTPKQKVVSMASGTSVISLPPPVRVRAFELLAVQPRTLVGLSHAERDRIVVTAVADAEGNEYPVSRIGDREWDLSSEFEAKNRSKETTRIVWPVDLPQALVDDVKAVLYCVLRRGRDYAKPWTGSAVVKTAKDCIRTLRHLVSLGIRTFSELRALHISDYIADLHRSIKPTFIRGRLTFIDLVWHFSSEVFYPLSEDPWGGLSLPQACGETDDDGPASRTGKTPVIPVSVQRILFAHCESRLEEAESLFRRRDAGDITESSYELTSLRDAILYLLQICSGMRNSESTGVRNNCWRTEVRNGQQYHWVRTREIKTRRGDVEFLVPPEAISALQVLQRYAEPLQARLAEEGRWLEVFLMDGVNKDGELPNGMTVVDVVQRLNRVREIGQHLFLGLTKNSGSDLRGTGPQVDVMSLGACSAQLKTLAKVAGVEWSLANHQCRRTFAFNVANSRLGRMGLIFLKWQLKHASVSWTQLYASNPYQDHGLYREMEEELVAARVGLMEGWLRPDEHLAGGAGKKLLRTRATPVKNREALLRHTAEVVNIRSTGHAWCLSGTEGCRGQGLYDPTMCGGCSQAVIDTSQASQWQMIHLDNLRLAAITDCGPAVAQKSGRAIKRSAEVLTDLGVPLPTDAQAEEYYALTRGSR